MAMVGLWLMMGCLLSAERLGGAEEHDGEETGAADGGTSGSDGGGSTGADGGGTGTGDGGTATIPDTDTDTDTDTGIDCVDADGDGYGVGVNCLGEDCDDSDSAVNPGAEEICNNGRDDDCDGGPNDCGLAGILGLESADVRWTGSGWAGYSIGVAGDLDGDGIDDLIVGEWYGSGDGSGGGVVHLLIGPSFGGGSLSGESIQLFGQTYGDGAGSSVLGLGDVDGDGFGDVMVGATGVDDVGAVMLVLGPVVSDMSLSEADTVWTGSEWGEQVGYSMALIGDLAGDGDKHVAVGDYSGTVSIISASAGTGGALVHTSLRIPSGNTNGQREFVAGPGDVNGDGIADLAIGAAFAGVSSGGREGKVYLFLGPVEDGVSVGDADLLIEGEEVEGYVGWSVAGAGDVDADGLPEILIGAIGDSSAATRNGAAFVVSYEHSGVISVSSAQAKLVGLAAYDDAGHSVAGAGDVDLDGYDDILIGAPHHVTSAGSGVAYLVQGPMSGTMTLDTSDAVLTGEASGSYTGATLAGGGDFNGDGRADVVVGAYGLLSGSTAIGAVYLYHGGGM